MSECAVGILTKDVGGIVGHLVLQHGGDALHAHAGVHVLGWQALQAAICLPVELQARQHNSKESQCLWDRLICYLKHQMHYAVICCHVCFKGKQGGWNGKGLGQRGLSWGAAQR